MRIIIIFLFSILTNFDTNANPLIDIRCAKHNDKIRIVVETLNKPDLSIKYDAKKILLSIKKITFKNYTKSKTIEQQLRKYYQIKNISINDKIAIDLKDHYTTKHFLLEPGTGNKNYRFVIDIFDKTEDKKTDHTAIQLKHPIEANQKTLQSSMPEIKISEIKKTISQPIPSQFINKKPTITHSNEVKNDKTAISPTKPLPSTHLQPNFVKAKKIDTLNLAEPEKIKIILDPGHGGKDTGTKGLTGILEKQLTLQYAIELKKYLSKYKNLEVILTRKDDSSLSKFTRNKFVDSKKPELFISLHADSHNDPNMRGLSVYTLSEENYSDEEAKRLAENEEKSENKLVKISANNDTEQIMNQLIFRHTLNSSAKFAKLLTNELENQVLLLNNSHRFANFRVLKNVSTPSVLIELGYLSNKDEEKLLKNNIYKKKIINSIANAITKHFNIKEEL